MKFLIVFLRKRPWLLPVALAFLLAPVVLFRVPAVQQGLLSLIEVMRNSGVKGVAIYLLVYGIGGAVAAPKAPFHVLAGFVYGPVWGVLAALGGVLCASSVAFGLGRTALRGVVRRRLSGNPTWEALQEVLEEDGLRMVGLVRMTPVVPQNFFSFAASSTRIRYPVYALGTLIGLLPIICFQAYVGSIMESAAAIARGEQAAGAPAIAAAVGGLILSAVGLTLVMRLARKKLNQIIGARAARDAMGEASTPVAVEATSDR
ncbi:MAG: VTT domain-containing protein [Deltaproteobacteria bacterium]|nr:VTT domain-containing protein [Deltaproteobacteria bacterium]